MTVFTVGLAKKWEPPDGICKGWVPQIKSCGDAAPAAVLENMDTGTLNFGFHQGSWWLEGP